MTVAVVDDYVELARLIRDALAIEGLDVRILDVSLDLFNAETWAGITAAVVDLAMPVSGIAVLGYLKANHPEIRRVACSAAPVLRVQAADLADAVVPKPFRTGDLLASLRVTATA